MRIFIYVRVYALAGSPENSFCIVKHIAMRAFALRCAPQPRRAHASHSGTTHSREYVNAPGARTHTRIWGDYDVEYIELHCIHTYVERQAAKQASSSCVMMLMCKYKCTPHITRALLLQTAPRNTSHTHTHPIQAAKYNGKCTHCIAANRAMQRARCIISSCS